MFISWPEESIKSYLKGGLVKREGSFFLSCDPAWEAKTFETVTFDTYRFLKKATCVALSKFARASSNNSIRGRAIRPLAKAKVTRSP